MHQPAGGPPAAFVFSVILARSSLHDALMGLEWAFGRKQWHLSALFHQDSSSEPGPWSCVSSHWPSRLLMALFCRNGGVKLGSSPGSFFESISTSQTKFLVVQNRLEHSQEKKKNHTNRSPPTQTTQCKGQREIDAIAACH